MSEQNLDSFSVGEVISKSLVTLIKNLVPFFSIGFVLYLPVFLVTTYLLAIPESASLDDLISAMYVWAGTMMFLFLALFIAYGAITFGTIRSLQDRPAAFGEILSKGFSRFFPIVGISIVSTFATLLGLMLFIVPGFIVLTILYLAVPATVVERTGVFDSLNRSADLTRGVRLKIFGIYLVVLAINIVAGYFIEFVYLMGQIPGSIVDLIVNAFFLAFGAVVAAVAYQDLRRIKEGVDIDTIAAVFS